MDKDDTNQCQSYSSFKRLTTHSRLAFDGSETTFIPIMPSVVNLCAVSFVLGPVLINTYRYWPIESLHSLFLMAFIVTQESSHKSMISLPGKYNTGRRISEDRSASSARGCPAEYETYAYTALSGSETPLPRI
jgi:hypothetical protein